MRRGLLVLRPGRALKVSLALSSLLSRDARSASVAAAVSGAASAVIDADLSEESMLGDTGANALGALLGVALLSRFGRVGRVAALAAVVGLTLASEKVSCTEVIVQTPVLRQLDAFGRRPRD